MKKFAELKLKSEHELEIALAHAGASYHAMRFKVAQRQLKNVRSIRQIKKEIAQLSTALKQHKSNNKS